MHPPDALERRLRWLHGTAAAAFVFLGSFVVLASFGLLGGVLAVPGRPSPWVAFAVAFSALGALLAARVARAPRRHTFLMAVLGVAMLASGATLLGLSLVPAADGRSPRDFVAGASIDLAAAALFFAAWLRLWFAAVPGEERARRDWRILAGLLEALVPEGGAAAIGAADDRVSAEILRRRGEAAGEARIRLELRLLHLAGRVLARQSLADGGADGRAAALERLSRSRLGALRRIALAWREAALRSFYADPRVLDAIGFGRDHLERRLAEGPNRDAHRERLATGRPPSKTTAQGGGALGREEPPVLRVIRSGGPTSA